MTVLVTRSDHVWTVEIDRPDVRNAIDPETSAALFDAFSEFEASDARAAVFTGRGGAFCAGWDLREAARLTDPDDFAKLTRDLAFPQDDTQPVRGPLGPTRLELTKPVIAAVEGPAVAGGMELALWSDLRIMGASAYMGVYCRRWGVALIDGGTVRLPRLVGQGRALEITLTGRKVPAEECLAIGLCEKVVPDGDARRTAHEMAAEIARFPQGAMRADRASIHAGYGKTTREALKAEWARGIASTGTEGTKGAARFASGKGRHGDFTDI